MEAINPTILKTCIEAIPILTEENFSSWRSRIQTLLQLAGLKDSINDESSEFESVDNNILCSVVVSKLSISVHANIINMDNEGDVKAIWKDLLKHFVSTQPANRARIFNSFQGITYNPMDIQRFITEVKTGVNRLSEVGIVIPKDILTYMILGKLPAALDNIKQRITHSSSEAEITPDAVLDHLRIHMNKQRSAIADTMAANSASLYTDAAARCRPGAHNPRAAHSMERCYFLHPELRPKRATIVSNESYKKGQ